MKNRLLKSVALVIFVLVVVLGGAHSVFAAPQPSEPIVNDAALKVHLWPGAEPGKLVVLVRSEIPETYQLPVRVRIPIPDGFHVVWAGELTTQVGEDLTRAYTTEQGAGGNYIEVIASETRAVQADLLGPNLNISGSSVATELQWVQSAPAARVSFDIRVPAGARQVEFQPAAADGSEKNPETGEVLYSLPTVVLAEGESQAVSVSWSTASAKLFDLSDPMTWMLIALVFALLGTVAFLIVSLRAKSQELDNESQADEIQDDIESALDDTAEDDTF